jgi:hypothetical protein
MSTIIKDGGPAFPGLHPSDECRYNDSGMTLRDYFAGQALAGMMANKHALNWTTSEVAADCYFHADAMLEERRARQ